MTADDIQILLEKYSDPMRAEHSQRFFKTGKGHYGEGDIFIGVTMPQIRQVCKPFRNLPANEIKKLIKSPVHEHRMAAVVVMAEQGKRAKEQQLKKLFDLYMSQTKYINNWDLVDISCNYVVGKYVADNDRKVLYKLAKSKNIWERRISIVSTGWLIRAGQLDDTFRLAEILLKDQEDLIHKAVGWMLREAGKKDEARLKEFLNQYHKKMPRTMLRYSLEKLHSSDKAHYMKK